MAGNLLLSVRFPCRQEGQNHLVAAAASKYKDCDGSSATGLQMCLSCSPRRMSHHTQCILCRTVLVTTPAVVVRVFDVSGVSHFLSIRMCVQFDLGGRSHRAKSDSLCGLEEVLSNLPPSVFVDEQLSKYKVSRSTSGAIRYQRLACDRGCDGTSFWRSMKIDEALLSYPGIGFHSRTPRAGAHQASRI